MGSLIKHVELHLGPIEGGWSKYTNGTVAPFTIVRFRDQPHPGVSTYLTLGLSNHVISLASGRPVRQELLLSADRRFDSWNIPGLLGTVGREVLTRHQGLLRGEVLGPAGPLLPGSSLEALYCASPVHFPDSFAVCGSTSPPTVFVWLIPIASEEAEAVRSHGWSHFEDVLVTKKPDLFDLERAGLDCRTNT